jgi:hypothetical protein
MNIRNEIIAASREHFKSHIRKHLTNINVMLENPRSFPDHTDIMDAIEKEINIIDEYDSKLAVLEKYLSEPATKSSDNGNGQNNGNNGNNDQNTTTTETVTTDTTQQDTTVYASAGSHVTIERPFTTV